MNKKQFLEFFLFSTANIIYERYFSYIISLRIKLIIIHHHDFEFISLHLIYHFSRILLVFPADNYLFLLAHDEFADIFFFFFFIRFIIFLLVFPAEQLFLLLL